MRTVRHFGYPTHVVNDHISAFIERFGGMPRKDLAQRVARYYCLEGSPLRSQLVDTCRSGRTVFLYPTLSLELQEHSAASIVSHQVEGSHRSINHALKYAQHGFPAYVCSRLRNQDLHALNQQPRFVAFAAENLNKRGSYNVTNMVARHLVPKPLSYLDCARQKFHHMYQTKLSDQYNAMPGAVQAVQETKNATKLALPVAPAIPQVEQDTISLFRCMFANGRGDCIMSVPKDLLTPLRDGLRALTSDDVMECFDAVASLPRPDGEGHNRRDHYFFDTIGPENDQRYRMQVQHALPERKSSVKVRVWRSVGSDGHKFVMRPDNSEIVCLDFSAW